MIIILLTILCKKSFYRGQRAEVLYWKSLHFGHFLLWSLANALLFGAFLAFFLAAVLGAFSCSFSLDAFYKERKAMRVCGPVNYVTAPSHSVKVFTLAYILSPAAVSGTDLQFRLFARCFYGNQHRDFLFLLLLLLLLHLLLSGGFGVLGLLRLPRLSSLKFTHKLHKWAAYFTQCLIEWSSDTRMNLFSPLSEESWH